MDLPEEFKKNKFAWIKEVANLNMFLNYELLNYELTELWTYFWSVFLSKSKIKFQ